MKVFVGGSGRSGTTVIAQTLGTMPNTLYFGETRFISDTKGMYDYTKKKISVDAFKQHLLFSFKVYQGKILQQRNEMKLGKEEIFLKKNLDMKTLDKIFKNKNRIQECRKYINWLFDDLCEELDKVHWVEKTPHTILMPDFCQTLVPDSKYVHILRDPKGVINSVIKQNWGPNNIKDACVWYCSTMKHALKAYKKTENYCYIMSLEELAKFPIKQLNKLCVFLDITVKQLTPTKFDKKLANIWSWKKELKPEQILYINRTCNTIYKKWLEIELKYR